MVVSHVPFQAASPSQTTFLPCVGINGVTYPSVCCLPAVGICPTVHRVPLGQFTTSIPSNALFSMLRKFTCRYQGRADTMKRHWLTHHTNEGPWVPDRYPPFEDLWRLVQEGEIVITPPSKYAYDSPGPEQLGTASASGHTSGGDAAGTSTGRRNSIGTSAKPYSLSKMTSTSPKDKITGRSRSHSDNSGLAHHFADSRGAKDVRFSRGNTKPWRISKHSHDMLEDEEEDEVDELDAAMVEGDVDVEMENATSDASYSPSHHSPRNSPPYPQSVPSQRSPRSPASPRSVPGDNDPVEVDIHVPYATIPPITPLTPASAEPIVRHPLHPATNYPVLQPSNFREHAVTYNNSYLRHHGHTKSKDSGLLGLLALSALQGSHASENTDPNAPTFTTSPIPLKKGHSAIGIIGQYVYGHGKESPPGPAYTPASIPHSELSLLSHPPNDRNLPPSPSRIPGELPPVHDPREGTDVPYPPMRVSPESERHLLTHITYETWQTHRQTMIRPFTVASH